MTGCDSTINRVVNPVSSIVGGSMHTVLLMDNGAVLGVGDSYDGQLGIGSKRLCLEPVYALGVNESSKSAKSVAAGMTQTYVVLEDGSVLFSGYDMPVDTTYYVSKLVDFADKKVKQVFATSSAVMYLMEDGTLMGAGFNSCERLGFPDENKKLSFISPEGIEVPNAWADRSIVDIGIGNYHTLFLLSDKTLWGIGLQNYLGNGKIEDAARSNFKKITVGATGTAIEAISVGDNHSLVLLDDGSIWAFGINNYGQMSDKAGLVQKSPVKIIDCISNYQPGSRKISAGANHSLILFEDGSVKSFGRNQYGQLGTGKDTVDGNGNPLSYPKPEFVSGVDGINKKAKDIFAGDYNLFILFEDGSVMGFGYNEYGQLGDGSLRKSVKVPVSFRRLPHMIRL